jgi:glutathione S-transferase
VAQLTFWGVTASPYQLKMQALADQAEVGWQRWPEQTGRFNAVKTAVQLSSARRSQVIERYPQHVPDMDEYPAVPYYRLDSGAFYYDSSGLALHLDALKLSKQPLFPQEQPLGFICQLIDEAFDEFGLYMVHHNRWVTSAQTNRMGAMTAREMRKLFPPGGQALLARKLPRRQARRCPYLFSVAPQDFDAGVSRKLTPPAKFGFPPTHKLLDTSWRSYLAAMENVLADQPYLLGQRFTLADASAYGQLSMNLVDGKAAELLEQLAPQTFNWLCMIRDGRHKGSSGEVSLNEQLGPLVEIICSTFVPLMQQNEAAYITARESGQSLFNEAAFEREQALYDGSILGQPFRAVVKSFQVPVWRDLCQSWAALTASQREQLRATYPPLLDKLFRPPYE